MKRDEIAERPILMFGLSVLSTMPTWLLIALMIGSPMAAWFGYDDATHDVRQRWIIHNIEPGILQTSPLFVLHFILWTTAIAAIAFIGLELNLRRTIERELLPDIKTWPLVSHPKAKKFASTAAQIYRYEYELVGKDETHDVRHERAMQVVRHNLNLMKTDHYVFWSMRMLRALKPLTELLLGHGLGSKVHAILFRKKDPPAAGPGLTG